MKLADFKPPFQYDRNDGHVYDSNNNIAVYLDSGSSGLSWAEHHKLGQIIADALTKTWVTAPARSTPASDT